MWQCYYILCNNIICTYICDKYFWCFFYIELFLIYNLTDEFLLSLSKPVISANQTYYTLNDEMHIHVSDEEKASLQFESVDLHYLVWFKRAVRYVMTGIIRLLVP